MSIFVENRDLKRFTAPAKTKEERVRVLMEKNVPFDINGAGDILVLRTTLESYIDQKMKSKPSPEHNFNAL